MSLNQSRINIPIIDLTSDDEEVIECSREMLSETPSYNSKKKAENLKRWKEYQRVRQTSALASQPSQPSTGIEATPASRSALPVVAPVNVAQKRSNQSTIVQPSNHSPQPATSIKKVDNHAQASFGPRSPVLGNFSLKTEFSTASVPCSLGDSTSRRLHQPVPQTSGNSSWFSTPSESSIKHEEPLPNPKHSLSPSPVSERSRLSSENSPASFSVVINNKLLPNRRDSISSGAQSKNLRRQREDSSSSDDFRRRRPRFSRSSSLSSSEISDGPTGDLSLVDNVSALTGRYYTKAKAKEKEINRPQIQIRSSRITNRQTSLRPIDQLRSSTFDDSLRQISGPPVTFYNDIDHTTPDPNFQFINDYIYRPNVQLVDEGFVLGCECRSRCDPDSCECIFLDDTESESEDDDDGVFKQPTRRSKIPTYHWKDGLVVLREDFLKRKSSIQECNSRCSCGGTDCWNHVVQNGRTIPLEIFHTGSRGFGLRSPKALRKGQYIERYLGEVMTDEEATLRELSKSSRMPSYLFTLDFFESILEEDEIPYVIDGEFKGSVTRFINHSCHPNCKLIPVSYHNAGQRIHYLAFFATRNIPAYTELTFDYNPSGEKQTGELDTEAVKCLCGERNCRGQLWPNKRKETHETDRFNLSLDSPIQWAFGPSLNHEPGSNEAEHGRLSGRRPGRPKGGGGASKTPQPAAPVAHRGGGAPRRGRPPGSKMIDGKLYLPGRDF